MIDNNEAPLSSGVFCFWDDSLLEYRLEQSKIEKKVLINMSDDHIYDDINLTKRKTITNGIKYNFYIYKMLSLEKKLSNGKFGKGDTVISQIKNYRLQDDESEEMLEVKLKCSKKIDDSINGFNPGNSKKIFDECLNDLEKRGMVKV